MFKLRKNIWLLGVMLALNISAGGEEKNSKTPVLWYHFDEGWGNVVIDSSGKSNNGKVMDGAKWSEGKFGGGVEFDGKMGCVICPDSPTLHLGETVSVTMWFKPKMTKSGMNIFFAGSCKNRIMVGGNGIQGSYSVGNAYCAAGGRGVIPNEWNYAAMTYNGEKTAFYLNGKLTGEMNNKGGKLLFSGPIFISSENRRAFFFDGAIDEVKIYNYALSQEDVQNEYIAIPPGLTTAEKLAVLKKNSDEKIEALGAKFAKVDKKEISDFIDILESFKQLRNSIEKFSVDNPNAEEKDLSSNYISFKNTWDELNSKIQIAENALTAKIEKEKIRLQTAINKIQGDIKSLKNKALAYRASQTDADMAGVYLNLGNLGTADIFKKMNYLERGFASLGAAYGKISKVQKDSIKDSVKGLPGEFMVGATYSPYESIPAFETFKALKMDFAGNSSSPGALVWNSFFNPNDTKLEECLKSLEENKIKTMLVLMRPDYQFSGRMAEQKKYQDECVNGKWGNLKGAWLVPAAPSDIPLKWVAEQEKYLRAFIEKYKKYKSIAHWDVWGESHPLSPFYESSPLVAAAFRSYLEKKYEDIAKLNKTWKTDYKNFSEIQIDTNHVWNNAEWSIYRHIFLINYITYLTNIVKELDPDKRPISPVPDMYQMYPETSALDPYLLAKAGGIYKEAGMDIYAARRDKFPWQMLATYLDTNRSVSNGARVWIGEMGHWVNHGKPAHTNCTYPEETKEWSYTAFLHGAKAVAHFAWVSGDATAGVGEEGDGFALMHSDYTPFETAIKIAETACETRNYKELWSCMPERTAAIYYPRLSALLKKSSSKEMYGLHAIMNDCGFGADPLDNNMLKDKLSKYKILVIPPAPYMEEDAQKEILKFVKNGGVVITSSTALFNEWGDANTVPELSGILSEKNGNKEYSPYIKSVNKSGKGVVCIVGDGLGRDYRQDWNIGAVEKKMVIDFDRKENADLRKTFLTFFAGECNIVPSAVSDKEGVETAVISNDKGKYLIIINHRDNAVEPVITLAEGVYQQKESRLYDIFTFKDAQLKLNGNKCELKTSMDGHDVQIFPLK